MPGCPSVRPEASYKAKLATADAQAGALLTLLAASEAFVRATVGSSPDPLHDFGLMPRKVPAPRTAAQKAAAAVKGRATRAARHTMGSVQKVLADTHDHDRRGLVQLRAVA